MSRPRECSLADVSAAKEAFLTPDLTWMREDAPRRTHPARDLFAAESADSEVNVSPSDGLEGEPRGECAARRERTAVGRCGRRG